MIALIAGLLAATSNPPSGASTAICDVGLVALRDLPSINQNVGSDTYYGADILNQRDILAACPKLIAHLPVGYPLADSDARARARVVFPKPGEKQTRSAFIYFINVTEMSADLKTAVVHLGYSCTGLCGSGFEARYVRAANGWQRQGEIRLLYES